MASIPDCDDDGTVDGAGLVYEAVELTSLLRKIDGSGKIQAIFTGIGAALMWKTAIIKGVSNSEVCLKAFQVLNKRTRIIMNDKRPAGSTLQDITIVGCEEFDSRQKFELLEKLFGTHKEPFIFGEARVHFQVSWHEHKGPLPDAIRLRLPLSRSDSHEMAIAMNPLLLLGQTLLILANLAHKQRDELRSFPQRRDSTSSPSSEKTLRTLEFKSLRTLHSSSAWDSLTVLHALEEAVQSLDPRHFALLVAGFPLTSLHASKAKITLRNFFADEDHVKMENFLYSEVSKPIEISSWLTDHTQRVEILPTLRKHQALLELFIPYFHRFDEDPEAAYPQVDTQNEESFRFDIFPKTPYVPMARQEARLTRTHSSSSSFVNAPVSPFY